MPARPAATRSRRTAAADSADLGISIEHAGETLRVWTGVAAIDVPRSGSAFLSAAEVGGLALLESTAIVAEDAAGARYQFAIQRTTVERAATLRAVIRIDGELVDASNRAWLDATMRLHFFAGLGTVKAELSITNPRAARHPGGVWDLGDAGSVLIRDLSDQGGADAGTTTRTCGDRSTAPITWSRPASASRSTRNRAAARTGSTRTTSRATTR